MNANPRIETQEDLDLVKLYTLLPMLLDMLVRDREHLKLHEDKIIYHYFISHLNDIEALIFSQLRSAKIQMGCRGIRILTTKTNHLGVDVEYKVRGYIHHFQMLRALVKSDLMTLIRSLGVGVISNDEGVTQEHRESSGDRLYGQGQQDNSKVH